METKISPRIGGIAAAAAAAGALLLIEIQVGKWRKFPMAGEAPSGESIAVFAVKGRQNDYGNSLRLFRVFHFFPGSVPVEDYDLFHFIFSNLSQLKFRRKE